MPDKPGQPELTLEQRVLAQKVLAAADPRRFLLAFKVLDDMPRTNSGLQERFMLSYPGVAQELAFWCNGDGKNLGRMCERSLSAIGLATYELLEITNSGNLSFTAMAWKSTQLVQKLSALAHFIQEGAHRFGISAFLLFGRLSGPGLEAPMNKALIISELAAQANYKAGTPVMIGNLEGRVGLESGVIFGHLEKLRLVGLVDFEPPPGGKGKRFHYRWISKEKPTLNLRPQQAAAAAMLYTSRFSGNGQFVAAERFSPVPYSGLKHVRYGMQPLVREGVVERRTKYFTHQVTPSQLCIDISREILDPFFEAVAGDPQAVRHAETFARSFRANEPGRLLSMARSYVAASKII